MDNTIRIARLKLLFLSAKILVHSGASTVKYSQHDGRAAGFFRFLAYLAKLRHQVGPWLDGSRWPCRHLAVLNISWGCARNFLHELKEATAQRKKLIISIDNFNQQMGKRHCSWLDRFGFVQDSGFNQLQKKIHCENILLRFFIDKKQGAFQWCSIAFQLGFPDNLLI